MLPVCNTTTQGQFRKQGTNDSLSSVPVLQHPKLIERLNLLIEYQNTEQWEKVYDLLIRSMRGGRSRADYASSRREMESITPRSTLLAFVPTEAIPIDAWSGGGEWQLMGCAQYRRKEGIIQLKSAVGAELRQGEWFFTEVGVATQLNGPEEPCSTQVKSTPQIGQITAQSYSYCDGCRCKK
jgi:hypothetical protein